MCIGMICKTNLKSNVVNAENFYTRFYPFLNIINIICKEPP